METRTMHNPHHQQGIPIPIALALALGTTVPAASVSALELTEVKWESGDHILVVKGKEAERRATVIISNAASGVQIGSFSANKEGKFEKKLSGISPVPCRIKAESNGQSDQKNVRKAPSDCDDGVTPPPPPPPGNEGVSINSTSRNSAEVGVAPFSQGPVPEPALEGSGQYQVLAINDLGMHCGDLDTRISSILPPFQVALAQVILKGQEPQLLDNTQVDVFYAAASNPNDPILATGDQAGVAPDGSVYKTNFWDTVDQGSYDPFYPPVVTPLSSNPFAVVPDLGLPVPDVERLYLGDGALDAVQQAMPGIAAPYQANAPQKFEEFVHDKPFFTGFPFGYVADGLNWFEAPGIPMAAFDDFGRENPYPLVRVQAKSKSGQVLASVDTVLPISGEANCQGCHAAPQDGGNGSGTGYLVDQGVELAASIDDPAGDSVPHAVSVEWASDINILKLHDLRSGTSLITGTTADLSNPGQAPFKPVVCQTCHYTPALDLAQVGPLSGPADTTFANGRNQLGHESMSRVMHYSHDQYTDGNGASLFPDMPPALDGNGNPRSAAVAQDVLEQTCYQCHPGSKTQCLRGAMFNGGMVCQDCHGNMEQVGDDFSENGNFVVDNTFYDPHSGTRRVPWANEPGCGSCHTGDALDNLAGSDPNLLVNPVDSLGNADNIRLKQAFRSGDAKATPIVPSNLRFAENRVPADFEGTPNNGAGNPKLYRVSTGHGGVFCEACHGATHAEWPNANPFANDNVTANQLQGHTGTIIECGTCHTGDLGNTLDGPHGMHPVGDVDFVNGGHEDMLEYGAATLQQCAECHGDQGQGTVLSVTKTARSGLKEIGSIAKGMPVDCGMCHGNPYTEEEEEDD